MSNWLQVSIMHNRSNGVCLIATDGCVPEETDTGCFSMTEEERAKKNGTPDAEANAMRKRRPGIGAGTEEADAMKWEATDEEQIDTEVRKGFDRIRQKTITASRIDWRIARI
jgi:hypothetical protein